MQVSGGHLLADGLTEATLYCNESPHPDFSFPHLLIPEHNDILSIQALPEFKFWRMLFEEQHLGDCGLTGRFVAALPNKPPRIAVNNHQEEKQ